MSGVGFQCLEVESQRQSQGIPAASDSLSGFRVWMEQEEIARVLASDAGELDRGDVKVARQQLRSDARTGLELRLSHGKASKLGFEPRNRQQGTSQSCDRDNEQTECTYNDETARRVSAQRQPQRRLLESEPANGCTAQPDDDSESTCHRQDVTDHVSDSGTGSAG